MTCRALDKVPDEKCALDLEAKRCMLDEALVRQLVRVDRSFGKSHLN
jgi:hypothetical protein